MNAELESAHHHSNDQNRATPTNATFDREVMQMAPSGNVFLHATRRKALIFCNPSRKKKKKNN